MHEIYNQAQLMKQELTDIRHHLHQNAEVGRHLPKTKAFVKNKLIEYGYEPKDIANSSLTAQISGNIEGKTILLRADMDGLAIKEECDLEFKSLNDTMHGCGHDMHTTMLLGAAKLLKQHQDKLCGTVKLLFQEDEEGFTGAKSVIKEGILQNPKVDAAMALHINSGTPSNTVLCGLGHFMAGCTLFKIEITGVGSHGAMPEYCVDPINIATHIFLSLQEITSREVAAQDPCVLTVGKLSAGQAANIIPEKAVIEGTIRYKNKETGDKVFERICQIADLCARSFNGTAVVTETASAPPLINNNDMMYEFSNYVKQLIGDDKVFIMQEGGMGSEDFASFSYEVPTAYLLIGAGTAEESKDFGKPMHNPCVIFNEDILPLGSAILTVCAVNWLSKHKDD